MMLYIFAFEDGTEIAVTAGSLQAAMDKLDAELVKGWDTDDSPLTTLRIIDYFEAA